MEKELTATAAAVPNNPTEAKCPVKVGAHRHTVAGAPTKCGRGGRTSSTEDSAPELALSDPMGKGVQLR